MTTDSSVDVSSTINEVIAHYPETITVFNAFGIDMCCGGDETIEAVTAEDAVDRDALMAALQAAISGPESAK